MGCASSMKVAPSVEQNGAERSKKKQISNGNSVRADRMSLADARARRKADSRNRLRRISLLQPEEVDKVRRNSSSSKVGGSFNPLPEEDDSPEVKQTVVTKEKKMKKKKKRSEKENKSPSAFLKSQNKIEGYSSGPDTSSSDNMSSDEKPHNNSTDINKENKKLNSVTDDELNLVVFNPVNSTEEDSVYNTPQCKKTTTIDEYPSSVRTSHYRCDGDGKTDSPFSVELHCDENNIDTRKSVDSLRIKSDANVFVNNIMTQALLKMNNDEQLEPSEEENNTKGNLLSITDNKNKPCNGDEQTYEDQQSDEDNISVNSTIVNEHAKGLVGNVLSNALFVVSADK